ncbi:MAG: ComEC/Rec2 family competence protein [Desulfitobacterium hafniense]|nr:ComEC/Rec2 family competence protein [Desulfitobacterium hafniense]
MKVRNTVSLLIVCFLILVTGCSSVQPENKSVPVNSGVLKVTFIDVGQGDSILIKTPSGKHLLIDGGPKEGEEAVLSTLKTKGVTDLSILVTHNHADHISALDDVVKQYKVNKIYMPEMPAKASVSMEKFLTTVQNKGLKLSKASAGLKLDLDEEVKAELVAPLRQEYEEENNYSAVLRLNYGETNFLFTGDAESLSEKDMLDSKMDLKATVLKIGHHGSQSSTSEKFLKAVSPKYAVISVGKDNDYNHPSDRILKRLQDLKVQTYRTDLYGTITVESDGKNVQLKTSKKGETK